MTTDPQSERSLIRRASDGDEAAFEALLVSCRPRLATLVRDRLGRQLRRQVEVDDVLQETALRAFRSLGAFEPRGEGSFFRWLSGIAVNVVREASRRGGKIPIASEAIDRCDSAASRVTSLRREERFDRLADAMRSLPQDYQQVIRLTRFEKLPPDEVARRLNRSRQAVRSLLFRALQALKQAFGETESLHLPQRRVFGGEEVPDGETGTP